MKILIIDDNEDILELLKVLMDSTGHDVYTVNNGKQGLDMILKNEYNLVMLDITMPEFSGFSVVDELVEVKELKKNKILFFTAASISDIELKKWYDAGVKGCLRKPVDVPSLFEKINEVTYVK